VASFGESEFTCDRAATVAAYSRETAGGAIRTRTFGAEIFVSFGIGDGKGERPHSIYKE
jgi:hypothetical protein